MSKLLKVQRMPTFCFHCLSEPSTLPTTDNKQPPPSTTNHTHPQYYSNPMYAEEIIEYPSKELLNDYFKFNGNILEITFNNKDKTYIIIFENENAIESLMIQNRLHIISQNINAANNAIHNINNPSPSNSNISNGSNTPVPASPD
eukprot:544498_1